MIYVCGPGSRRTGNGGQHVPGGHVQRVLSATSRATKPGMKRLFTQFSFPGGIPSHVAPETPGSIHEGGELGYSLLHAYGAVFDNPDLLVCCVVGDGEAETGSLATSWHSNKFLNPARDGAVLPILHLNGYKIAGPTVLARIPHGGTERAAARLRLRAVFRRGRRAGADAPADGRTLGHGARRDSRDPRPTRATNGVTERPRWPMIVLRSPKGWTGPKVVDGLPVEGTFRAHQVPVDRVRRQARAHRRCSKTGCEATVPKSYSTANGKLVPELAGAGAARRAAHGRESACQRRRAAARSRHAGFPRRMPWMSPSPAPYSRKRRACWANCCAT